MDNKTKELIAIGASLTANCQFCLQFHSGKAHEAGASEQEIALAIEIGRIVRRGAASKMDDFTMGLKNSVEACCNTGDSAGACCDTSAASEGCEL